ncbi:MAG: glycosyltransferase [Bacteroidota bacterium]
MNLMPENRKRLIYIISNINNSLGFEWLAGSIDKNKFEVEYVFLNPDVPPLMKLFISRGYATQFIKFDGKKDLPSVTFKLIRHFSKSKPDIVHGHLFEASLAGMAAAWFCRIPQRIYTRHHSTLHHREHPSVVKYDKLINFFS